MMRRLKAPFLFTAALFAGCVFEPNLCSYERRDLHLGGVLTAEGYSQPANAEVRVEEARHDGVVSRQFVISAETYYPGYLGVLTDSMGGSADTVITVPMEPYVRSHRRGETMLEQFEEPSLQYLRDAAEAGRLVLEVHPNNVPWPPLSGRMAVVESSEWHRPTCAGT